MSASYEVSSKVKADWVELINDQLDKLSVHSPEEAKTVSAALSSLVSLWGEFLQGHSDLRVAEAAQRVLSQVQTSLPEELSAPLKKRIESIQELLAEPDLYVQVPDNFLQFQNTVLDRIRGKIEELGSIDASTISQRAEERAAQAAARDQAQVLMQGRRMPSPVDDAATLSEHQGHWSYQIYTSFNELAASQDRPPFTEEEVDDMLRALGDRSDADFQRIFGKLWELYASDPDLFADRTQIINNAVLKLKLWPEIVKGLPDQDLGHIKSLDEIKAFLADPNSKPLLASIKKLDLSSKELWVVPREIGLLTGLAELELSNNQLDRLPSEIGNLMGLKLLSLGYNRITILPDCLLEMTRLTTLHLGTNMVASSPPGLYENVALNLIWSRLHGQLEDADPELDAHGVRAFFNDPENASKLEGIKELDLNGLNLKILPPEIGKLKGLIELNLDWNDLKELPDELGLLTKLEKMILSINHFDLFPPVLTQLKALKYLSLDGNLPVGRIVNNSVVMMTVIPPVVKETIALNWIWPKIAEQLGVEVVLHHADEIKAYLSDPQNEPVLRNVRNLILTDLDIEVVPECLTHLTGLEMLFLKPFIPRSFWDIPMPVPSSLVASMSFNWMFRIVGEKLGLDAMPLGAVAIREYLANEGVRARLSEVAELDLSNSGIRVLPQEIGLFTGLVLLNLEGNSLVELPEEIGELAQLKQLNVSRNMLQILPASLRNLQALEVLNAERNQIKTVHQSLADLDNLKEFRLGRNPMTIIFGRIAQKLSGVIKI
ncbi:MAG: leucine-rich repeat domain-containing protein [Verrucomicrobia bacterium]|nr:leucine-rich repeat domain-containing protein [Verrucomicrobiota bacterium]